VTCERGRVRDAHEPEPSRCRLLESGLRSKDSRAVRRGAAGKVPEGNSLTAYSTARTVTTGGRGRHRSAVRPVPTHSRPSGRIFLTCYASCGPLGDGAHRQRRSQSHPTVDHADSRGLATTGRACVGCLPPSRHESAWAVSSRRRGWHHTGAAPLPLDVVSRLQYGANGHRWSA